MSINSLKDSTYREIYNHDKYYKINWNDSKSKAYSSIFDNFVLFKQKNTITCKYCDKETDLDLVDECSIKPIFHYCDKCEILFKL